MHSIYKSVKAYLIKPDILKIETPINTYDIFLKKENSIWVMLGIYL